MAIYRYIKKVPRQARARPIAISYIFIAAGLFILTWTAWPIASFMLFYRPFLTRVVSPISEKASAIKESATLPAVVVARTSTTGDYTNPNLWFPTSPQKKVVTPVTSYLLSVPKLGIKEAMVVIAGDDLAKNLIHYGGTGLPGEYGTTVIFGHSTLPQFFKPQDYKTIFSTLPTMKIGDEIFVKYDGVKYRYVVFEMTVTEPNDLSPLEQRFDDAYVTLITCVPAGTYLMRLNIKARLEKI